LVPESYLKNLEERLINPMAVTSAAQRPQLDSSHISQQGHSQFIGAEDPRRPFEPLVENSTAELFVSKLKQIRNSNTSPGKFGLQPPSRVSPGGESEQGPAPPPTYEYFVLDFDTSRMSGVCPY
jgi:hypothetical protein